MKSIKKPTYQELEVEIAELKVRYQFLKENGLTHILKGLNNNDKQILKESNLC